MINHYELTLKVSIVDDGLTVRQALIRALEGGAMLMKIRDARDDNDADVLTADIAVLFTKDPQP